MKLSALFFVVASACTVLAAPIGIIDSDSLVARSALEEAREAAPPDWKRTAAPPDWKRDAQFGSTPDWKRDAQFGSTPDWKRDAQFGSTPDW
ncbi:hypothetical protein DFH29DRAFT_494590 [Suillus ampliporus]|nr:hypothetical protein DFH29DRAFT_494590 [Suillus ampliporus]